MEKHFLDDFVHEIEKDIQEGFQAEPWYNPYGDCITYQTVNEATVANRIDEILTIYRSAVDDRPIGFQIKGVMALVKTFGWDGFLVSTEVSDEQVKRISLNALLLAAYEKGPLTIGRRQAYASVRPPLENDAVAVG